MWELWVHKQDETVRYEAREDGRFYEVRPVAAPREAERPSWRVERDVFESIYERKA